MKKVILFLLFVFLPILSYCEKKPQIILFHSSHCKACVKLETEFLPALKEKYKDKVEWVELNTYGNENNLSLLLSVAGRFKKEGIVPSMLVGDVFLAGNPQIEKDLANQIDIVLNKKITLFDIERIDLKQLFNKLSVFTVAGLGLVDGVNPCAFAVIVFFVSFLAVYGYKKREIICVGTAYCLAVFLTYLLLGLGVFKFFYALKNIHLLIKAFYYIVAVFCFFLSGCAIWDYFKFLETGNSSEMLLQLPGFLKKRINFIIGSNLRDKKDRGIIGLAIVSFFVGFLVSILEAACTGQVYVPTIVFILKNTNLKLKAFSYLLLYNFMFILPLLIIFVLSFLGVNSEKFNVFLKNNLTKIKLIMAAGFFILGLLILFIS